MRVREIAVQKMVEQSAAICLDRALKSKTRLAVELLELNQGDLVDFGRKPAIKHEFGWR